VFAPRTRLLSYTSLYTARRELGEEPRRRRRKKEKKMSRFISIFVDRQDDEGKLVIIGLHPTTELCYMSHTHVHIHSHTFAKPVS
jgi:hypothetical protein